MAGHVRNIVDPDRLNDAAMLPFSLRLTGFQSAMQDVNTCSMTSTACFLFEA